MKIIEQLFILIFDLLESIIKGIVELIRLAVTEIPAKKEGYNAKFTSAGTLLSCRNSGFCLTGRRNLTLKDSYQNSLIVGGTGTGYVK
jgi:hypothetical protein